MHSGMQSSWMENTKNSGNGQAELLRKLRDKTAVIGVIGLGYVGLPLAVEKAKAGYRVIGFDVQSRKIEMLNRGHNYIGDVVDEDLRGMVEDGRLLATAEYAFLQEVDAVAICVPTPLDIYQQPDTSYVENSTREIARFLHPGMLVVLESTTYPGTTEELVKPILEATGLRCGVDFSWRIPRNGWTPATKPTTQRIRPRSSAASRLHARR